MRRIALLCMTFLLAHHSADAAVRTVRAADDLQAAFDAARPGDELRLEPGATFSGNFVLPVKTGDDTITVRTDLPDPSLPAANQRVTPADAARFAKIRSLNSGPALRTAPDAHHWQLMFLEFPSTKDGHGDILLLGDGSEAQNTLAQVPHDLVLDHLYVHGDPFAGQKRGIALNARSVTIRNCYVSEIKTVGADSQAIGGWNGPGPFLIENNYLEASGEVFMLGGADPAIPDLVPSDVVVRYNHMTRPMAWRGTTWEVKNIFELKNARRVQVEYNLFENNWLAAQPGYAIVLTPRNQDGKCPWCVVESVEFSHNVVRNSSAGLNISGYDSPNQSRQANTIRIVDNLFYAITTKLGGNGWGVLIGDAPRDVIFDHNTFDFDGTTLLYAYGGGSTSPQPIAGFVFTNNAAPHGQYGMNGSDSSTGAPTLQRYFPGAKISGNWLSGGSGAKYPAGNRFETPFDAHLTPPPAASGRAPGPGADVAPLLAMADAVAKGLMSER